jgi:hypothetical protein
LGGFQTRPYKARRDLREGAGEGRAERLPEIAAEFVRLNVSLTLRDAAPSIGTSWQ